MAILGQLGAYIDGDINQRLPSPNLVHMMSQFYLLFM